MSSENPITSPNVFPEDFLPERWMSGTFGQGVKYLDNEKATKIGDKRVAEGVDESVAVPAPDLLCALDDDGDHAALSQPTAHQRGWGMCWAVAKASEVTKLVSTICFGIQRFRNWTKNDFAGAQAPSPVESFQDFERLFNGMEFFRPGLFHDIITQVENPLEQSKLLIWITMIKYFGNLNGWENGGGSVEALHIEINKFFNKLFKELKTGNLENYFIDLFSCQLRQITDRQEFVVFSPDERRIEIGPAGHNCVHKVTEIFTHFLSNITFEMVRQKDPDDPDPSTKGIFYRAIDTFVFTLTPKKTICLDTRNPEKITLDSVVGDSVVKELILDAIKRFNECGLYALFVTQNGLGGHAMIIGRVQDDTIVIRNSWGSQSTGDLFGLKERFGIISSNFDDCLKGGGKITIGLSKVTENETATKRTPTLVEVPRLVRVPPSVEVPPSVVPLTKKHRAKKAPSDGLLDPDLGGGGIISKRQKRRTIRKKKRTIRKKRRSAKRLH